MCVTPKTISHCNQKTNIPPQLCCTLSSTWVCKPKPFSCQNQKLTQHTAQLQKRFLQSTRSECIWVSVSLSVCQWGLREAYRVKEFFTGRQVSICTESSIYFWEMIATVRLYYLTTNIFWLVSCFSKIKKWDRHFLGNQSVIASVRIFDTISYLSLSNILISSMCKSVRYKRNIQNRKIQSKRVFDLINTHIGYWIIIK